MASRRWALVVATVWTLIAYADAKKRLKALEEKSREALIYILPVLAFLVLAFFLFQEPDPAAARCAARPP